MDDDIRADVDQLVRSAHSPLTEEETWDGLRRWGPAVAPYLAEAYDAALDTGARASLVHHAIPYARTSDDALRLGLRALDDLSPRVRRQACALLAYSLDRSAVPRLTQALASESGDTQDDAHAALVAIESGNHHYFRDRDQTGRVHWIVNPGDEPPATTSQPSGMLGKINAWLWRD